MLFRVRKAERAMRPGDKRRWLVERMEFPWPVWTPVADFATWAEAMDYANQRSEL